MKDLNEAQPVRNPDRLNAPSSPASPAESGGETKSASHIAVISLGGKAVAFLGRTLYIGRFGAANPLLNAFTFALNVPTVFFGIIGTALSTVMIPVYNSLLAENKHEDAKKFIDNVISISMVILSVLVLLGIATAPVIARVVAGADFPQHEYLTFALRVLMPVMLFFGASAIFQGLLQSHGVFRLPAFVSLPGGLVVVLYVIFLGDYFGVTGLVFAVAGGLFLQPLIMVRAVRRLGYRYKFSFDLKNKDVRTAGRLSVPVLVAAVSFQVHFLFANAMALRFGTAAIMDYAQQLVQVFVLAIVFGAIGVYFPKLSAQWARADSGEYNKSLRAAFTYTLFLVLPIAGGFMITRYEIMDFLLNWRESGYTDVALAGNMMGIFAIGIIAISMKEVADRAFYSAKDSVTPAVFGVVLMVVSVATTVGLMPHLGAFAMPVAYCVSAFVAVGGLMVRLFHKTRFADLSFAVDLGKIVIAVACMAAAALFGRGLDLGGVRLVGLVVPAVLGAAAYFGAAFVMKVAVFKKN